MDPETPGRGALGPKAQRARTILFIVTAALVVAPALLYLLVYGAGPHKP
jgi:hypothetical protein